MKVCPVCTGTTNFVWDLFWITSEGGVDLINETPGVVACSNSHAIAQAPVGAAAWTELRAFDRFEGEEYSQNTVLATHMDLLQQDIVRKGVEYDGTGEVREGTGGSKEGLDQAPDKDEAKEDEIITIHWVN